jgi:diacylglycerol kinase (ATP)
VKARILLNPAAGRGRGARRAAELERIARRRGVEVVRSASGEDLRSIAARSAAEGCERLLVAGGDGSYHHAAQGLARTECALVPLPLGTGNDLARELGVPFELARAIAIGLDAPLSAMDLGRIGERYFCGVAGSGIDSAAAEYSLSVKRLRGPLVYVWSVLVVIARFRAPRIELELDGRSSAGAALLVAFANTRCFGGGMRIAPNADRADGLFDVVRVGDIPRHTFLSVFPRVYFGRHLGHPACTVERAARAVVRFDRAVSIWGDGERLASGGPEPVTLEVAAGALRTVVTGLAS